jgi:phosphomethylpyrimidine kinase
MENINCPNINRWEHHIVFLIAGSEPLGSAGIQADIKAISACGGYAAGAITCIVDEDTVNVKDIITIPIKMIESQCHSFLGDVGANCIKTGMLYSKDVIHSVAGVLQHYKNTDIVVDPVMVSSAGYRLLKEEAVNCYMNELFPLARIITPNRHEAEVLLGHKLDINNLEEDLKKLTRWGNAVIVKSVEDKEKGKINDCFYDPTTNNLQIFSKKHVNTNNRNGTGDTFASAIATYIARGFKLIDAISFAEDYIQKAIEIGANYDFGAGFGGTQPFFRELSYFYDEKRKYDIINGK